MAINVPTAHIINDKPTLPDNERIVLGVAKTPVPITRLKIRNDALTTPIWRRSSGVASKTCPSSNLLASTSPRDSICPARWTYKAAKHHPSCEALLQRVWKQVPRPSGLISACRSLPRVLSVKSRQKQQQQTVECVHWAIYPCKITDKAREQGNRGEGKWCAKSRVDAMSDITQTGLEYKSLRRANIPKLCSGIQQVAGTCTPVSSTAKKLSRMTWPLFN